ncbi:MAG TPA: hypothetical protein DCX77_02085 [Acidimicrobiaceae bacterium]|nr:hypothetical protein [Acidimicrobiaceae bacterium]
MTRTDLCLTACLISSLLSAIRWLRVAQREHYLALSASRFALRWWRLGIINPLMILIAATAAFVSIWFPGFCLITATAVSVGPVGLRLKGRTSSLAWTRRLRTVAGLATLLICVLFLAVRQLEISAAAYGAIAIFIPFVIDAALALLKPIEQKFARRYVLQAADTLERINPIRVAITGSYGKTTIKGYVRHLLSESQSVVASPASFNNSAGLSRAVNEHLHSGTDIFVAEMGTYGPGEIADLVSWVRPSISVLSAIGPVHLERFGDLDTIVSSKSEIFATSKTAIINIDAYGLAAEAARLQASGINVLKCSAKDPTADVFVNSEEGLTVTVSNRQIVAGLKSDSAPTNVACAVAVAVALDVPDTTIAHRLATLPGADHRRQVVASESGVTIIDDTYNSNPAGAAAALETLIGLDANRKVVVTPGMVELGNRQNPENRRFGVDASLIADDLLIVGRTNRSALINGSRDGTARVHLLPNREEAIRWVRGNLKPGDAVLYENDLPDHYA